MHRVLRPSVRAAAPRALLHPIPTHIPMRYHHNKFNTQRTGSGLGTASHRIYFKHADSPISPWHDIPLFADQKTKEYNMVVEIPRWTNAKLEIDTRADFNPIKQDSKKGSLRYVADVFPYKGYIWNYGALPQTFEDPEHIDNDTKCVGDGDPVDVIEIGQRVCESGSVVKVKVLGVFALIDGGETDWKVVAVRSDDPLAQKLNDISDVESTMPGLLDATVDWFTGYKVPDGKPENPWAFDGKPKNAAYAHDVIAETHKSWKKLIEESVNSKFSLANLTASNSEHTLKISDALERFNKIAAQDQHRDCSGDTAEVESAKPTLSKWYFVRNGKIINE